MYIRTLEAFPEVPCKMDSMQSSGMVDTASRVRLATAAVIKTSMPKAASVPFTPAVDNGSRMNDFFDSMIDDMVHMASGLRLAMSSSGDTMVTIAVLLGLAWLAISITVRHLWIRGRVKDVVCKLVEQAEAGQQNGDILRAERSYARALQVLRVIRVRFRRGIARDCVGIWLSLPDSCSSLCAPLQIFTFPSDILARIFAAIGAPIRRRSRGWSGCGACVPAGMFCGLRKDVYGNS